MTFEPHGDTEPGGRVAPIAWHPALGLVLLVVLAGLGLQLVAAGVRTTRGVDLAAAAAAVARDPITLGLSQLFAFGLVLEIARRRYTEGAWRDALALRPCPAVTIALALAGGAALQLPLAELGAQLDTALGPNLAHAHAVRDLLRLDGPVDAFATVLAVVVIAPIAEELLFRGVLLPGLSRRHGVAVGLTLSALYFGLMHGRVTPGVVALAAGLVLGALRLRARSLLPCVAAHVGVNAVPVLLPASLAPIPGVNVVADEVLHVPLPLVAAGTVVAAIALALAARTAASA